MANYTPPRDSKAVRYFIPSQPPNQDHDLWYSPSSVQPAEDDLEANLLPHSASTPPPPYQDPDPGHDSGDDDWMDRWLRFARKVLLVCCAALLVVWLAHGGWDPENPLMWRYYGDEAVILTVPAVDEKPLVNTQPDHFWRPGTNWVQELWEETKTALGADERDAHLAYSLSEGKPSNKPVDCKNVVWREGQLRTDGC